LLIFFFGMASLATRVSEASRTLRRRPRQARSRDTVEVLVEAGARVLAGKGWSGFTTNEVAATAGVSIGSLYQYFPNKLALLDAVRNRHLDHVLAVFDGASCAGADVATRVTALVDGMIEAHCRYPGLHRALLDEAPQADAHTVAERTFQIAHRERMRAFVATATGVSRPGGRDAVASILGAALEGMVHEAARHGADDLAPCRSEIVRLVVAYLTETRRTAQETRPSGRTSQKSA
jgi:AcrR family transcriptional regulator